MTGIDIGKIICSPNNGTDVSTGINPIVQRDIKNNRGKQTNKIYQTTPMYSFTLTPQKIKNIRSYNSKHAYNESSDSESTSMHYDRNAKVFYSDFIRDTKYVIINKGSCLENTSSSQVRNRNINTGLIICAES